MELEKEIELLKEKLALLEKIKELQGQIKKAEIPQIVPYPVYPSYPLWPPWIVTTTSSSQDTYQQSRRGEIVVHHRGIVNT